MNTPNKLTLARMIATPVFMATVLIDFPYHYTVSVLLFIAASITDLIDGKMARKYNIVTNFGKFLDPLADKMLTTSAYLGFMFLFSGNYGLQMTIITFIVLLREFMISSIRLVTAKEGLVVAANIWGKLKTVTQMVGIVAALVFYSVLEDFGSIVAGIGIVDIAQLKGVCDIIIMVLFWISTILCVISGLIYLVECKDYINTKK